jgi:hypothetical protein
MQRVGRKRHRNRVLLQSGLLVGGRQNPDSERLGSNLGWCPSAVYEAASKAFNALPIRVV